MKQPFLIALFLLLFISGDLYAQAPVISSFSPAKGDIGNTVIITGHNFNATQSVNIVNFDVTGALVTSATANQLTVKGPVGAICQPQSRVLQLDITAFKEEVYALHLSTNNLEKIIKK
jgi:hypothetical protein